MPERPRPVVLCILDGWGYREETDGNAIAQAATPVYDRLLRQSPWSLLKTSAEEVGLPGGQMGNSEVGHTNIGAGRVVLQDLPRIDAAVADGSLDGNGTLRRVIARTKDSGGRCHLLGLVSPGGVHSHQAHIAALARIVSQAGVPVLIHALLDGRDTPPRSAGDYLARLERDIAPSNARIASVGGRYFAMDRDKRWDRVERAYRAIVSADAPRAADPSSVVAEAYAADVSDEFVTPTVLDGYAGMADGDALIVANFRADRVRQILSALLQDDFAGFDRGKRVRFAAAAGMASYSTDLDRVIEPIFPPLELHETLGEIVARAGLTQLRIAETEKYAHVTFFFNGGEERGFDGEERILVPSPKVATYDLQPEMAAPEVTGRLVEAILSRRFDLIVCNLANADMVGHTGRLRPAIAAIEAVDRCLGRIEEAVRRAGASLVITADHGNAERMNDPQGGAHTAHTVDDVPFIVANAPGVEALDDGRLADVAPTVLRLLGLPQPAAMTGRCLARIAQARETERDTLARAQA